ncbi:MAG TPA: hypothetical protein VGK73_39740 [Polyangiaceae bacterium]
MTTSYRFAWAFLLASSTGLAGCGSSEDPAPGGNAGTGGTQGGGGGSGGGAGVSTTVSYSTMIAPIFEESCVPCHYTGNAIGIDIEQPFTPGTGLVDSDNTWAEAHPEGNTPARNVVPGDPDNSFLMQKIGDASLDPATAGQPMPWQVERLTEAQLAALRDWITAGAMNDATFTSAIRPILGREGSLSGKCVHCHWSGGERPNLQDPFDPATGAVGVASSRSALKRIEPGDPDASFLVTKVTSTSLSPTQGAPMPAHFPRLTASEVQAVRTWILEGALDN